MQVQIQEYRNTNILRLSSTKNLKPRFYNEHQKTPDLPSAGESCQTTNTTTFYKSQTGNMEEFTLVNPNGCSFPFNYKGTWYTGCIVEDDPFCRKCSDSPTSDVTVWCRLWCSVSNDQGYHRRLGSKWAYCREDCPGNITEKCDKIGMSQNEKVDPHFIDQERQTFDYVEYEAMTRNTQPPA